MSDYVFRQNINCGKDTIGCKEIRIPNEVVKQIRAEVIEECMDIVPFNIADGEYADGYNACSKRVLDKLEQLKESEEV